MMMTLKSTHKIFVPFLICGLIMAGCGKKEPPEPPPPAPSALITATGEPGNEKAILRWNNVSGATSYNVYMASAAEITTANFSRLPHGAKHATSTSPFTLRGLVNDTTFYFIITAVNAGGESAPSNVVSAMPSSTAAVALATGGNHTCVLISSGSVKCWGANFSGQLGNGAMGSPTLATSQPADVITITTAVGISAGRSHTCALLEDNRISCWGENKVGQLGNGGNDSSATPIPVSNINNAISIHSGDDFSCAQLLDATLSCWGSNKFDQLGVGADSTGTVPKVVSGIKRNTMIATGYNHVCADSQSTDIADRKVKCWGKNASGQLGINSLRNAVVLPETVRDFQTQSGTTTDQAIALAGGAEHTCVIISEGSVNCFGSSETGQIGNSTSGPKVRAKVPALTSGITTAKAISAGDEHTCVILADNSVQCWGGNIISQLGIGSLVDSAVPLTIRDLSARAIAAGKSHTCAIRTDNSVVCWGYNGFGQLGNGRFANSAVPRAVPSISVQDVFLGENHTCALIVGGGTKCWGSNVYTQLANLVKDSSVDPVDTSTTGTSSIMKVGAGGDHTCAILADKNVQCWGRNRDGQLGIGNKGDSQPLPVSVTSIENAEDISGGGDHTCAISFVKKTGSDGIATSTKAVSCWGKNSLGQLGNGSTQV